MCRVYFILLISLLRYSNFSAMHLKFNSAHSHIAQPELSLEAFFLPRVFVKLSKKENKEKLFCYWNKSFILTILMLKKNQASRTLPQKPN